ncbi:MULTISPECIES: hypothetical protein [unclassified Pseudoalteromonas]|uniref:hypothetical protein n=1 Tax=unclassified Pseudoalteromonas TaxID=194690 RepID=UPI001602FA78|nr:MULTISPECIES: hypothetical protein [unclassified Pseudoalteromonas]MBB1294976.1 hypothetical protein [Pseudoalteromonas sp. SR41-4]MBB1410863.1 hypothetical protein [Pseudoalteromonas sp. SG44-17]
MSVDIFEHVEAIKAGVSYFENQDSIIDAVSSLEMMVFLENAFKGRKVKICANYSKASGYHFTIDRPKAGYIVLNSVSGQWHHDNYIEQFLMRIRLCELSSLPYQWVNEQNERNHDIKLLIVHDGDKNYLEARRYFDLYGGVRCDNLCKTIEDFTVSAQLLSQIVQRDMGLVRKRSEAPFHHFQSEHTQH